MAISRAVEANEQYANIGSKTLDKLLRTPGLVQSLTPEQLGMMKSRVATARWPQEARIVYDAVQDGYVTMDTLPVATGLTDAQITDALKFLGKQGVVKITPVEGVKL